MPSLYLYLIGGLAMLGVGLSSGFYLDDRLNQNKIAQLAGDLAMARGNVATLGKAVDACNLSVDGIATAGKALTAATQTLIDAAAKDAASTTAAIKAANAVKSDPQEKCPVADAIISGAGLQ